MHFLNFFSGYYPIILILQAVCVFHCVRKGNQQNWIWLIVFLPAIGCLIYFFTEIVTKREVSAIQSNLDAVIRPVGRIKDLKRHLEFSHTFDNKVALADAYLESGMHTEAIGLYENALTDIFADNPYATMQLMKAYFQTERYEDVIRAAQRILKSQDFMKSHAHVLYALSHEHLGRIEQAEQELSSMKGRYSNFEGRFNYGQFLARNNRKNEAKTVFNEILNEASNMTRGESRNFRIWFKKTREELDKIER